MSTRSTRQTTRLDHSESEYSKYSSSNRQKEESTELSEYPEYFMNVLRIDNTAGENDSDTSEDTMPDCDTTSVDDADGRTAARFAERASRKISVRRNGKTLNDRVPLKRGNHRSTRTNDEEPAKSLRKRSTRRRRRRRIKKWKEEDHDSAVDSNYKANSQEENSSACRSDGGKGDLDVDANGTAKDEAETCDCNARQRHDALTNDSCACKRNLRNTATAIMRDIQEQIREIAEITRDAENSGDEIPPRTLSDDSSRKQPREEPDRDDGVPVIPRDQRNNANGGDNDEDVLFQESGQSSRENIEPKIQSPNFTVNRRRRRKRFNRWTSINCDLVDRTKTTYHSAFHECDLESSATSSSLKINMTESWKPEDGDNDEMIHSSFRSSLSGGCDEHDSALLLARKIISDLSKDGDDDGEDETMASSCYKYDDKCDETSDSQQAEQHSRYNSAQDSSSQEDEDMKENAKSDNDNYLMKDVVTYKNKNKVVRRSSADQNLVKSEKNDTKVSDIRLIYCVINRFS